MLKYPRSENGHTYIKIMDFNRKFTHDVCVMNFFFGKVADLYNKFPKKPRDGFPVQSNVTVS